MTTPPVAAKRPHTHSLHGIDREDPWQWLREKEDPEVISHLEAENTWTESVMAHTSTLRRALYDDMLSRIQETDESVPYAHGPFEYYQRSVQGKDYEIFCRRRKQSDVEEIMLDVNALAEGHDYCALGDFSVSPDHKILAYSIDTDGSETYTLYFKDLETGKLLEHSVPETYGMVWANDNRTFFFATLDETHRPWRIHRLTIDEPADQAVVVFEDPDEKYYVGTYRSADDQFIFISCASSVTSEVRYIHADQPEENFTIIEKRRVNVEYDVDHRDGKFIIITNDSAVNFRICEAPISAPGANNWQTTIAERDDVTLMGITVFDQHLVVSERAEGIKRLVVHSKATGSSHVIEFDEPVYEAWTMFSAEFKTTTLRFGYTSLTTPRSVFDYEMDLRTRKLLKVSPVLGGFNKDDYISERLWVPARDGTAVPLSIVHRKDLDRSKPQPLIMIGYGSYGASYPVSFSTSRLALMDRGLVCAIAHVRGGQEMGRRWYEDGKYLNKPNTFNDFVDCARHLVDHNVTSSQQLGIMGGSAGGLLMGAVINQAPDLFKAVVAQVPFVDVVTTILDTSLPLSKMEWEEWGNPNEREYFDCMMGYSPYDNVGPFAYPAILATAGLNDPRVSYWEPAKWVARLREHNRSSSPVLLKTNMGAGHGGASGRYEALEEKAFEYAFVIDQIT